MDLFCHGLFINTVVISEDYLEEAKNVLMNKPWTVIT